MRRPNRKLAAGAAELLSGYAGGSAQYNVRLRAPMLSIKAGGTIRRICSTLQPGGWQGAGTDALASLARRHLSEEVLKVARRDPDARVLVVVNVQYCHVIREQLRTHDDVEVTTYTDL